MSDQREVKLAIGLIAFDGRVLELFGVGGNSRRIHLTTVEGIKLEQRRIMGRTLTIQVEGQGETEVPIMADESQAAALDELVSTVDAARGAA